MFVKSTSLTEETRWLSPAARGSRSMPWSRSRRRAAAYASSVELSMGLMTMRMR